MTSATQLALVIHFHQPVGNLDSVVRNATERCYRPFLEVLADYEDVRMTLHYSGCLLEWLEANEPAVTLLLRELVSRGQVELMTGGFYEPVLAALPHRDQVGQIEMLTKHLRDEYLARPTGLWLAERVWEQDIVGAITEAGANWTVVDDTMFHGVGIDDEALTGPFVTEHEGRPLLLYAGDRNLRYLIPYKKVDRVFEYLQRGKNDERLFVYADDGEKFGEWPDTHERVYENKWLARFFEELLTNEDWLRLTRLGDHAATAVPRGRVYLPSSSYHEMMTWALPSEARLRLGKLRRGLEKDDPEGILPFLRGAPWRAFLAKYAEVNQLQKRMLHVSNELHDTDDVPDDALRELYRSQCNCAYWHGAFGGVYLGFMRGALWHHLMRAEGMVAGAAATPVARKVDINADTLEEVLLTAPWGAAVVAPHQGGALVELDDWTVGANLLAVVSRHREAYHVEDENPPSEEEPDEDEMEVVQPRSDVERDSLIFDEHARGALIDILDEERITGPYDYEVDAGGIVRLWTAVGGIRIEKSVTVDGEELLTAYEITNNSGTRHDGTFAMEASVMPLDLGREVEDDDVEVTATGWTVARPDAEVNLAVTTSAPGKVASETIETAAATLEGMKAMKQGTAVTTTWALQLDPSESFAVEIRWRPVVNEKALTKRERGVSADV